MSLSTGVLDPPQHYTPGLDIVSGPLSQVPFAPQLKAARKRAQFLLRPEGTPARIFAPTRTIFVRIPKNASSSLMQRFYPEVPSGAIRHWGADFYRRTCPAAFAEFLVFAPLRNPVDRFISAFTYYKEVSRVPEERRLMDETLSHVKTLEDFIAWLNDHDSLMDAEIMSWHHFRRQGDYICDMSGRVIVDLLFPVEDMAEGLAILDRHTGRNGEVKRLNSSRNQHVDDRLMGGIMDHYAQDMRIWQEVYDAKVIQPTAKAAA